VCRLSYEGNRCKEEDTLIEFVVERKTSQEDKIRDKIRNYAAQNEVDVLFIGSFGAKGQDKPGHTQESGLERVGASAQACIEQATCTTVIVKGSTPKRAVGDGAVFLVGVDGSDISHQGFLQACHLAQPEDTVLAMTIGETDVTRRFKLPVCFRPEIIVQRYNELLTDMHMGKALLEYPQNNTGLGRHFVGISEKEAIAANYLVFGSKGLSGGKAALGSVAAYCVKHARVGVIVIKTSSRILRTDEVLKNKGLMKGQFK